MSHSIFTPGASSLMPAPRLAAAPRCALLKPALRNPRPPLRSAAAARPRGPAGGPGGREAAPAPSAGGCLPRSEGLRGRPVPPRRTQLEMPALASLPCRGASELSHPSPAGLVSGPHGRRCCPARHSAPNHCPPQSARPSPTLLHQVPATCTNTGPAETAAALSASGRGSCLGRQLRHPQARPAGPTPRLGRG